MPDDELKLSHINEIILDSIADGVFTVDQNWRITFFNKAAENITGVERREAIGKKCCQVFNANVCESDCVLKQTTETGKDIIDKALYIVNADGDRIPISVSTSLLKDDKGNTVGGVETFRDLTVVEDLRNQLNKQYGFSDIVSRNHKMHKIFAIMEQVADSNCTVLIRGESGTGKELVARAIHNTGLYKQKPFIAVNCSALPDNLLESELFGYKAGAFTDAKKDKPGRFALAEGGTIFLDEIGDISPALQVRLLRVLEKKEYVPLGGTKTIKAKVRIISATNKDLDQAVAEKKFRRDLYYRINVVQLLLPPLRERREDIPILLEYFISKFNQMQQREISDVSQEVLQILMRHDYPGNVRELENIVEHAFVLCKSKIIDSEQLPEYLLESYGNFSQNSGIKSLKDLEAAYIIDVLKRNQGNRNAAARELGIHKSTLFRKMKSLGIKPPVK